MKFLNVANIQIISGKPKHHSKQVWISPKFSMI